MFGLGPTELIVILILGVLLLGPQRIPEAAASLGKAIRSFRRATRELRDQIDIEDEVRRPLEDLRAALRDEPPPYVPPPPLAAPSPPLVSPPSEQILSTTEPAAPAMATEGAPAATATDTATGTTPAAATAHEAAADAAPGLHKAEPVGAHK